MPEAPLRPLTESEIHEYDTHGVVHVGGLFPEAWVTRMAAAVDCIHAEPTPMGRAVSDAEQGFTNDLFVWKSDDDFRDWVYDSPAAQVAQQVLREERIRHFYDQLFVKPPGCHVPTPWHHDVTFWPVDIESRNLCSIWITFDPISRATSGLEFVRGSHRWPERYKAITPTFDPYMMDSGFADPPDIDGHRDDYDLFCPDMAPGDCLIFDAHVVHGSSANTSTDSPRRAFATRWMGEGTVYDPRHATMPLLWSHGLEAGDALAGSLFPQVLPEVIPGECPRYEGSIEGPDPVLVQSFLERARVSLPSLELTKEKS
ncbi:MAG: phytanoyl-CoA dioxygenase family protein [Deltaproteobacteria bacterium]|nr:phytanoyl-CoA dioxygenase family protein [Deltaproteobacteria bacterium]MBW2447972.1 phytanoyl-CoA dioxygenase family protein [Deltaproteobacteria bacterium]